MKEYLQGANLFGIIAIMALFGWKCTSSEPTPAPVKATLIEAPAYTLKEVMMQSMLDLAHDKRRTILFRTINAPQIILYDTVATHPACTFNGKPMQVMEVKPNGFNCYRWVGDNVYMRAEGNQLVLLRGKQFKSI